MITNYQFAKSRTSKGEKSLSGTLKRRGEWLLRALKSFPIDVFVFLILFQNLLSGY